MSLASAVPFVTAHYALDEASASDDAIDSIASNDLTANNAPGAVSGLIAGARQCSAASAQDFSRSDTAALSGGGDQDLTICFYHNFATAVVGAGLVAKFLGGSGFEYLIRWASGPIVQAYMSANGSTLSNLSSSTFGNMSASTWYAIVLVNDSVNDQIRLYVNAVKDTTSHSGGVFDGTATFYLGEDSGVFQCDGIFDEFVFVKGYAFTDDDATEHYNGGAGIALADWSGGGGGGNPWYYYAQQRRKVKKTWERKSLLWAPEYSY